MSIVACGNGQAGDLSVGQVFPGADIGVAAAFGWPGLGNCPILVIGETSARCDFPMFFRPFLVLLSRK
jgi:hypothetical protein